MKQRNIGKSELTSSSIALGCMAMSEFYGSSDEAENLNTLQRAMDLGVTQLDTADLYGDGANEELLGKFLKQTDAKPLIASKCGIVRTNEIMSDGNFRRDRNGHPDYIREACEKSLQRLGVDVIDLYYLHRVDPQVPIEDSMGALSDLKAAGKIRAIGLSEPTSDELRRANTVDQVDAVQSEYSLWTRLVEDDVLKVIREFGATLVCFSPLGRGMIRAAGKPPQLEKDDFRNTLPRFSADSFDANATLFDLLDQVAEDAAMTVPQVMLCWLLAQGDDILPIPGARKLAHLEQNIAAADLSLTDEQVSKLSRAFATDQIAGDRYTQGKPMDKTA